MSWAASVLVTSSAFAGKIAFPAACWNVVDQNHYLIRPEGGDRTSDAAGARLWNLDKLTQDWSLGRGDSDCTQAIYQQAVTDGDQYWTHIGEKYHCNDPAVEPKPDVCTREKGYSDNHNYLSVVKAVMALPQGNGCLGERRSKVAQARDEAPAKLVKGVVPALQKSLAAQTADPKKEAKAPTAPSEEAAGQTCNASEGKQRMAKAVALAAGGCFTGIKEQFVKEVWDMLSGIAHAVSHPFDTASALAEFVAELRRNPSAFPTMIAKEYGDLWPDVQCADSFDISEGICKIATKAVVDIGLTLTGMKGVKWSLSAVKTITRNAAKYVGKPAVTGVGKAVGKITPKFIKNPIKKAGAAVANRTTATANQVADAVTDNARIAALKIQQIADRTKMRIATTQTGQRVLKIRDKAVLIAGTRAGKIIIKPTAWATKIVADWTVKPTMRFTAANLNNVDKFQAQQEKQKAQAAEMTKWTTTFAKGFSGLSTCADVEKVRNQFAAQYKPQEGDSTSDALAMVYYTAKGQLECK